MRIKGLEKKLFGQRLKQLRMLRNMSMDELSAAANGLVTKQAISKYEKGIMMPTSTVLIAFAKAMDVRPEYFFRQESINIEDLVCLVERPSTVTSKEYKAVQATIKDAMERYLEIESILMDKAKKHQHVPIQQVPESVLELQDLASWLRKLWHLGNQPISNVCVLLENHGIKILELTMPETMDGIAASVGGKELFVILNNRICTSEEKRFVALREAVKLLFDTKSGSRLSIFDENEMAENLAEEMLLPSEILENGFLPGESISYQELKQMQAQYGIAVDRIVNRLKKLGIVCKYRYRQFQDLMKKDEQFANQLTESCFFEETFDRFRTLVHAALAREVISIGKASELLNESVNDVQRDMFVL